MNLDKAFKIKLIIRIIKKQKNLFKYLLDKALKIRFIKIMKKQEAFFQIFNNQKINEYM